MNSKQITFFTQKGFSLAEIMVAAAIWSVVILGVSYGISQVHKTQNEMVSKDMTMNLKKSIASQLKGGAICDNLLSGTTLPNTNNTAYTAVNNVLVSKINSMMIKTLNQDTVRKSKIEGIKYRVKSNSTSPADSFKIIQVGKDQKKIKTVEFEFEVSYLIAGADINSPTSFEKAPPLNFEVPVHTSITDQFDSCSIDFNMSEVCASLGYVYDPIDNKCTANNNLCVFGDLFAFQTMLDKGDAATINAQILAGSTIPSNKQGKWGIFGIFLKSNLSSQDILDLNDAPTYINPGQISVECVTPNANKGLGCTCEPGFTAREASFFTKDRFVSCGKKCTTEINIKLRTFMCIKCDTP